ncbi:MAG TPA: glycosyltransferase family 1 protein [Bryobacteraceae bacterium]|jgi:glycosyltransferase involved in cell wall biosynthesis|nr:glycosyltransferase family 1 protein [Bryobacteraceae bacterium]
MRVALDATPLALSSGGLSRYTSELVNALAAEFPEDEYYLVSDVEAGRRRSLPPARNLKFGPGPGNPMERRWWLWGLQREMGRVGAELFHGTDFSVPYLATRPSVMSLHDLSPWMDRSWHSAAGRVRRRAPLLIRLGIATMLVTHSGAVRRQAIDRFRIHPERVAVAPLAASARFRPIRAARPRAPYFLYVGALEPRKNIPMLVDAWRPVRDRYGVDLLLAGRSREDFAGLRDEPGLRILGETADEDLPALYSASLAFVYPSLYEGFGLPVLEAMQCGACVITSTDPAIAEVVGDAAVRLDPKNRRAWTEALLACAAGGDWLDHRRERVLQRASGFSWRRTARATREVYAEARRRFDG